EAFIAEQNRTVGAERGGPFAHAFCEDAIRLICPLQRKELLSGRTVDGYSIDLSTANGVKSVFRFSQPGAQLRQLISIPANCGSLLHFSFDFAFKSSITRTRPRSDKSPIRRR